MEKNRRYELIIETKIGSYFYDSKVEIDLNLEMVLNRLNQSNNQIIRLRDNNRFLNLEVKELKDKISELTKRIKVYEL